MENTKKYQVNFALGSVDEIYVTEKGNEKINRFKMFIDAKGVHIYKRTGIVYLNAENCEVV